MPYPYILYMYTCTDYCTEIGIDQFAFQITISLIIRAMVNKVQILITILPATISVSK